LLKLFHAILHVINNLNVHPLARQDGQAWAERTVCSIIAVAERGAV
jgi:hypothetical protein